VNENEFNDNLPRMTEAALRVFHARGVSDEDKHDLLQDVAVIVWRKREQIRPPFSHFVAAVALKTALHHFKRNQRRRTIPFADLSRPGEDNDYRIEQLQLHALDSGLPGCLPCMSGGDSVSPEEQEDKLEFFLQTLPPRDRDIALWAFKRSNVKRDNLKTKWRCSAGTIDKAKRRIMSRYSKWAVNRETAAAKF